MSLRDKVAIVGAGCSKFAENWTKNAEDMIVDAVFEAYADAGIEDPNRQIDAIYCGSLYSAQGPVEVSESLKLFKPLTSVYNYCATGTEAFRAGCMAVAAGVHDTVLVVGYDKPKDRGVSGPSVSIRGVRDLPATPAGWFALCAEPYFKAFGAGREHLAQIAVKNHANGCLAPKSFLKKQISVEDALNARMISWPFGLYDCAAQTDGAAAVIITKASLARGFRDDPVLVKAVASASAPNPHTDPDNDFLRWKATAAAAQAAYKMAGIDDPFRQIDVAQLHDCFTLTELLSYEDLGFCEKGSAKDHIESGSFALGGALPVNTDGGLKSFGHPTGATGVRMIVENTLQLQGRAGARQVPNASMALSHNIGGFPTGCAVAILGRE
ncbi:acetyl-CoA acetyltransferase [Sphingomonas sp. C3-2]|uniref:acetyl-CoA acetyltransferase n=1 Tax=Sphingomonas sp. C3-2 TaxID=3062169 RepID=UPI00294AD768|nr:acetyl-CoA acetyltransferase [Sphingomonas sp. C3-2]WOK36723.1 acetyl-CoA acetyltransferase [Sphingomonas sp. C3-2]